MAYLSTLFRLKKRVPEIVDPEIEQEGRHMGRNLAVCVHEQNDAAVCGWTFIVGVVCWTWEDVKDTWRLISTKCVREGNGEEVVGRVEISKVSTDEKSTPLSYTTPPPPRREEQYGEKGECELQGKKLFF